jgi:hypothetical protein
VGVNLNGGGYWNKYEGIEIGMGIEGGFKNDKYFIAVETGLYGLDLTLRAMSSVSLKKYIPPEYQLNDVEIYYGFNAGLVLNKHLSIGVVLLWSSATYTHTVYYQQNDSLAYSQVSGTWFNIGPHVHFTATNHFDIGVAYTVRRGLKIGVNYLF